MADPLRPCYLLLGSDRPKIETAVSRLRERVAREGGEIETLHATAERGSDPDAVATGADVVGACNALALFGGQRVVLVRGVEAWSHGREKDRNEGNEHAVVVAAYLRDPAPDTVLVLVGEGLDEESPLQVAVAQVGEVRRYDMPDPKELPAWARRKADELGLRFADDALARLLELGGEDVAGIWSELEKLAIWADGEPVTVDDVERLCVLQAGVAPWDLTDAVGRRDLPRAVEVLGRELDRGEGGSARVLPGVARHLRRLHAARLLLDDGAGSDAVAKALGLKPYPARKLCQQAQRWSLAELDGAIVRVALAEREGRGEGVLGDRLSLERGLVEAMGPAGD